MRCAGLQPPELFSLGVQFGTELRCSTIYIGEEETNLTLHSTSFARIAGASTRHCSKFPGLLAFMCRRLLHAEVRDRTRNTRSGKSIGCTTTGDLPKIRGSSQRNGS